MRVAHRTRAGPTPLRGEPRGTQGAAQSRASTRACPGVDGPCRPHPTTLILSHSIRLLEEEATPRPAPAPSSLAWGVQAVATAAWRSPGVPPAGTCTCCPSRMLPGSRAAPCRTGAAAQAPRARHGHGARLLAPAGRYAGPARTPARLATGAAAPHGLAGGAVLTLGKDTGPQPHGACGQRGGRADAAGATDPGWRPC